MAYAGIDVSSVIIIHGKRMPFYKEVWKIKPQCAKIAFWAHSIPYKPENITFTSEILALKL